MSGKYKSTQALLRAGIDFHGHLGPHLAVGLRMGLIATRLLKPKGLHELSATVWTGASPPRSCLLDGIQVSSGCTLGKGNIRTMSSRHTKAEFRKGSNKITIEPTEIVKTQLSSNVKPQPQHELEKTAITLYRMPDRKLFRTTRRKLPG